MNGVPLLELMKDEDGHDRTFKRYWVNFPVSVRATTEEAAAAPYAAEDLAERAPGLTHNVSLSGIALVCAGRFEPAGLVEIEIALAGQVYRLLARVRRRQRLDLPGEALYHYGTQFVRTEAALAFIPAAAEFLLLHGAARRAAVPA